MPTQASLLLGRLLILKRIGLPATASKISIDSLWPVLLKEVVGFGEVPSAALYNATFTSWLPAPDTDTLGGMGAREVFVEVSVRAG